MNLVIFDGDDTLWDTQPLYSKAEEEFLDVAQSYGFARESTANYLNQSNVAYINRHGLGHRYYGNDMARCLRKLMRQTGQQWTKELARQVITIGNQVYTTIPKEIPGIIRCLSQAYMLGDIHVLSPDWT